MGISKFLKRTLVVLALTICLLGSYFALTSPAAYKICTTLTLVDELPKLQQREDDYFINIRSTIRDIPYQEGIKVVYVPKPEIKYNHTIIEGRGNCSNMAFGLMYKMLQKGDNYQIVHMLTPDGFTQGVGHTVVNMPYDLDGQKRYGIVDIFYAGIPQSDNEPIIFETLKAGRLKNATMISLNESRKPNLDMYDAFLDRSVFAVIEAKEIDDYFDFLDSIYIPLGIGKLEKYLYETFAFVCGKYPNVNIYKSDYNKLLAGKKHIYYLAISLTWTMRLFLAVLPLYIATLIYQRFREKSASSSTTAATKESKQKKASAKKVFSLAE